MPPQLKTAVAGMFRRFPWVGAAGQRVWALTQARYTVGAVGVVLDESGRVLLLEHVFHPTFPWGLPGGWVGRRESPERAVVRELREETGLEVKVEMPLRIDLGDYATHLDVAFLCSLIGGHIRLSGEILAYQWAEREALPPLFSFHSGAIQQAYRLWEAMQ